MRYIGLLLFCVFAAAAAKPTEDLQLLLRALLKEIDDAGVEERGIGAVKFGGTNVGEDYIEVKVIRHMDEVNADTTAHKPRYSILYGKGKHDKDANEHSLFSKTWGELEKCRDGGDGCFMLTGLTPNTMYWVQMEVQMWVNGGYKYIQEKKDVKQIKTKGRQSNVP